jgi:hypothetical protein
MLQPQELDSPEKPSTDVIPLRGPAAQTEAPAPTEFQFLERLNSGRHPCMGELWKVRDAAGQLCWLRLVGGLDDGAGVRQAIDLLNQIDHPVLLPRQVAEHDEGRLRIVTAAPEATLCERLQECRDRGLPGIPPREMLDYLAPVAQALDALRDKLGIQHLTLTPRTLLLHEGRPRLADYGVAQIFAVWREHHAEQYNAAYSAPELFVGKPTPSCDQFSLALIYVEMITGMHPVRVQVRNRVAVSRGQFQPDLSLVPAADRHVLNRALSAEPRRRYPSCAEFIRELAAAHQQGTTVKETTLPKVIKVTESASPIPVPSGDMPQATKVLEKFVKHATRSMKIRTFQGFRFLLAPAKSILHHCLAPTLPGMVEINLKPFCTEWNAKILESNKDHFVIWVPGSLSLVGALLAARTGVRVTLRLRFERSGRGGVTPVSILIDPVNASDAQAETLLEDLAPRVLASLRTALRATPERRQNERYPFSGSVYICPVENDQRLGKIVQADAFDLTEDGIGFWLREQPKTRHVYIYSDATPETSVFALLANIVRIQPHSGGLYEVGAKFCLDETEGASPASV